LFVIDIEWQKGLIKQETGCHRNIIRAQQQQACNPGKLLPTGHRDIVRAQQQRTFNRGKMISSKFEQTKST
jgi:hypothetical protein